MIWEQQNQQYTFEFSEEHVRNLSVLIDFFAAAKKHEFKLCQIPNQAQRLRLGFGYTQTNSMKLRFDL